MQLATAKIAKPEAIKFVLGQTHSIKTVGDVDEVLVPRRSSVSEVPSGKRALPCSKTHVAQQHKAIFACLAPTYVGCAESGAREE